MPSATQAHRPGRSPDIVRALEPDVVDAVFATIEPLLPEPAEHPLGCHRPRVPDRLCLWGILIQLVTGASWVDLEAILERRVSDTTLRARRDEWIAAGVFDQLRVEAVSAFVRIIGLDLTEVAIDGSLHKAPPHRRRAERSRHSTPPRTRRRSTEVDHARAALDRGGHQLLAVELRAAASQHRPQVLLPPRCALPGHQRAHHRQAPHLARPIQPSTAPLTTTYPLKSFERTTRFEPATLTLAKVMDLVRRLGSPPLSGLISASSSAQSAESAPVRCGLRLTSARRVHREMTHGWEAPRPC